jgi:hypothetical protein
MYRFAAMRIAVTTIPTIPTHADGINVTIGLLRFDLLRRFHFPLTIYMTNQRFFA